MRKKTFTPSERYAVFTAHGEKCYMCKTPLDLVNMEVDHIIPESLVDNPVRLDEVLKGFGLSANFDLNSFSNWMPACGRCNNEKRAIVFEPTPLIQIYLQKAATRFDEAKSMAEGRVANRVVSNAINALQRAKAEGSLTAEQRSAIEGLLTFQLLQTGDLVRVLRDLVLFHEAQRLPEMQGQPILLTPLAKVLVEGESFTLVLANDQGEETHQLTAPKQYSVQLNRLSDLEHLETTPGSPMSKQDGLFFGRRVIALVCRVYGRVNPLTSTEDLDGIYFSASGFIISIHNTWFLVTAGHVVEGVEALQKLGCTFLNWRLDDTFALEHKRPIYVDGPGADETIPFDFENSPKITYYSHEDGNDFSIIPLREHYVNLLRANGVTAFEEKDWTLNVDRPADRMELLGFPYDQTRELGNNRIQKSLVGLQLSRIEETTHLKPEYSHLLQAHIPGLPIQRLPSFEQIHGMSGGPIIGFWKQPDDKDEIRIVGIQSLWFPSNQTIVAMPVGHLATKLKVILEQLYDEYQNELSKGSP